MTFDESLPALLRVLQRFVDKTELGKSVVLRDSIGQLSFFAATVLDEAKKQEIELAVRSELATYARPDRLIADENDPGVSRIFKENARQVIVDDVRIRYLDRRIVGADWLHLPSSTLASPPRFLFTSLKGGVGRSTAISVVAADNARRGRNILVLDLDLEAPGIGSILLADDRLPEFGVLDYLVERNLGEIDDATLERYVGTSGLTNGAGLVDVVPVVGTRSLAAPANYLAKLARGMVEALSEDGTRVSVAAKLTEMLAKLLARRRYDLVLIDARAGFAEVTAGPLLGFGAHVLLFATAQKQSIDALRFLFAHLASLVDEDQGSPWQNFKMIHAKAQSDERATWLKDQCAELFTEYLYEEQIELEGFNFDPDDPDAPHSPVAIPLESAFVDWEPASNPSSLTSQYYGRTFTDLLKFIDDALSERIE